jgi:hypothetical protein
MHGAKLLQFRFFSLPQQRAGICASNIIINRRLGHRYRQRREETQEWQGKVMSSKDELRHILSETKAKVSLHTQRQRLRRTLRLTAWPSRSSVRKSWWSARSSGWSRIGKGTIEIPLAAHSPGHRPDLPPHSPELWWRLFTPGGARSGCDEKRRPWS